MYGYTMEELYGKKYGIKHSVNIYNSNIIKYRHGNIFRKTFYLYKYTYNFKLRILFE